MSPKRTLRRALTIVALAFVVAVLAGCTPEQQAAMDRVNDTRRAHGLNDLLPSPPALDKAQAWAEQLARNGGLTHSKLSTGMPAGWTMLAENVGMGPSIDAVHQGFLESPPHRANLLNPAWNWMGTGTAVGADGTVYVVQVFAYYP